ncbi:MAG: hypothetical protein O6650_03430 [Actinobacteria bacterium]|nr:hypothetical protein [Actinomycetota bacterium]
MLYEWLLDGQLIMSTTSASFFYPRASVPVGLHTVTLRVTDKAGASDTSIAYINTTD